MSITADHEPGRLSEHLPERQDGRQDGRQDERLVDGLSANSRPFEGRPAHGDRASGTAAGHDTATARRAMIDSQLRTSGVTDARVLTAMLRVPREDFVPATMRQSAYIDRAIPLENGRALAQPLVQGRILTEASPSAADDVLLVGDGDGYLAALLRPMVGTLTAIEPGAVPAAGDGPYSLIVVDGAAEVLPDALIAALADDGRIVTGLVEQGVTRIAIGRKAPGGNAGALALLPLTEIGIPVLPEMAAPKRWSF